MWNENIAETTAAKIQSAISWGSVVLPSSCSRLLLPSRGLLWLIPVCYEQSSFPQPVFPTNQPGSPARSNQAGRLGTDEQSVMQEFELEFGFCSSWIWLWLDQCRCKHKPRWLKFHIPAWTSSARSRSSWWLPGGRWWGWLWLDSIAVSLFVDWLSLSNIIWFMIAWGPMSNQDSDSGSCAIF